MTAKEKATLLVEAITERLETIAIGVTRDGKLALGVGDRDAQTFIALASIEDDKPERKIGFCR